MTTAEYSNDTSTHDGDTREGQENPGAEIRSSQDTVFEELNMPRVALPELTATQTHELDSEEPDTIIDGGMNSSFTIIDPNKHSLGVHVSPAEARELVYAEDETIPETVVLPGGILIARTSRGEELMDDEDRMKFPVDGLTVNCTRSEKGEAA